MTLRLIVWKDADTDRADTEMEVMSVGAYLFGWVQRDPESFPKWDAVADYGRLVKSRFDTKDEAKAFLLTLANADTDPALHI